MGENDTIPFMQKKAGTVQTESQSGSIWLKTIGSVLLILGLLFVGTWVFKKSGLAAGVGKAKRRCPRTQDSLLRFPAKWSNDFNRQIWRTHSPRRFNRTVIYVACGRIHRRNVDSKKSQMIRTPF